MHLSFVLVMTYLMECEKGPGLNHAFAQFLNGKISSLADLDRKYDVIDAKI